LIEPSFITSATETGASSVQRGKLTKMRPSCETVTPVTVNPLGVKGIGEIGIVGMNAAIANAVWHATGRRIRELPIQIENLL
jgi:hypothetical protein